VSRVSAGILARPGAVAAGIVLVAFLAVGAAYQFRGPTPLLRDNFTGPDGLVTNEWATSHPSSPQAVLSPIWRLTSGSLFRRGGRGWSGDPDSQPPGPTSEKATNSAVFRMVSERHDIMDAIVHVRFKVDSFSAAQESSWSGLHVFVRYQDPNNLLVVSVCRRDGLVVIKKKIAEGDQPAYYELGMVPHPCQVGSWHTAQVKVQNVDGSARVWVRIDGKDVLSARDNGQGGSPLTKPGRVGFRGDNVAFELDDVVVTPTG